jgi:hypothetical protein
MNFGTKGLLFMLMPFNLSGRRENTFLSTFRDLIGATRLASAWLRQLPLQPFIAVLTVALILGVIPLMLTAVIAAVRVASTWCRDLFLLLNRRSINAIAINQFADPGEMQ